MVYGLDPFELTLIVFFMGYLILASGCYLVLNAIAFNTLTNFIRTDRVDVELSLYSGLEPPITIIVPAYNEGATIVASVRSILQLHYPEIEVIIVNDGSSDDTLDALINAFNFEPFDEAVRDRIPTQPYRQVYLSKSMINLRLVDKDNGGKADAINAGINISRYPLFCCVDADSVLETTSLLRAVQPFLENANTVASGGTVRIANGCRVRYGHVVHKGVPANPLAMFQLVEYLRAFLFGRLGWARFNGLLIISGAFGIFHKESVVEVGGYATGTIGEDMELIVRLHRLLSAAGRRYRIAFTPDPVCWTEAPENLRDFRSQRVRWHRGLSESLWLNRGLLFSPRGGAAGWLSFPFFVLVEWLSPVVELLGYLFTIYLLLMTDVPIIDVLIVLVFAVCMSVFLSIISFVMDELTFPGATRVTDIFLMLLFSVLECFGYRQINMMYRIQGIVMWITGRESSWGSMSRSGAWARRTAHGA